MLVLSRKVGEELVLGDNIRVTVVAISGSPRSLQICSRHGCAPSAAWPAGVMVFGIDDFFIKPVEPESLRQLLAAASTKRCGCQGV